MKEMKDDEYTNLKTIVHSTLRDHLNCKGYILGDLVAGGGCG